MAAIEQWWQEEEDERPVLHLVAPSMSPYRSGQGLSERIARRQQVRSRRRRVLGALALVAALAVLAMPGRAFGGSTATGMPTDLEGAGVLAPGAVYVVQPGDTVMSIAKLVNPLDPARARTALVHELGSSAVVPGEHLVAP